VLERAEWPPPCRCVLVISHEGGEIKIRKVASGVPECDARTWTHPPAAPTVFEDPPTNVMLFASANKNSDSIS
jgi:hypothetical protein